MFSKCPAHGVWLPVPRKPASGLGRSSQLRTRQGVCAGKDCCTQPNGYEPRHRLAFGSVYLGFYPPKQAPPPVPETDFDPGALRLAGSPPKSTGIPCADHRCSHRRSKGVGAEAGTEQDEGHPARGWGLPRPLRVSTCNPCVHRKGKAWPGRLAQRGQFQKPAELTLHKPMAPRYQKNQGCVCRL